ncbi:MAG TPA: PIN domain-containing protein [Aggregatilineales bacterium]|nr:PIN domain-containing protein [Aggregatilineales bacterium]
MTHLVDTNIWLEVLLSQERADDARGFLNRFDGEALAITDFSLFSLGIVLTRLKKDELLESFVDDIVHGGILVVGPGAEEWDKVLAVRRQYPLDFDDAYQYAVAVTHDWQIVSFDHDFDRTERGRIQPLDA